MSLSSNEIANLSRISTLKMIHASKAAHLGSSLSVIDILSVLYGNVAKVLHSDPDSMASDQVLVSKGHAAAGTYAVLSHSGFFSPSLLDEYCKDGAALGGHVTYGKVPGIAFSTGSLGHGLPLGIGLALARIRASSEAFVYVVMSDGECDEGTTWESALIANQFKLGNLVALIDRNRQQSFGDTEETIALDPFDEKWRAFGWNVFEVDGHDHAQISDALMKAKENNNSKPTVLICNTTKGKGVSFMENEVVWHYRPPNDEQFNLALAELEALK
jgi:transketolase